MKQVRGWIGLGVFVLSIGMFFFEQTKSFAWLGLGFG